MNKNWRIQTINMDVSQPQLISNNNNKISNNNNKAVECSTLSTILSRALH